MMVGRLLSFWDGLFSGAMLNFQGVNHHFSKKRCKKTCTCFKKNHLARVWFPRFCFSFLLRETIQCEPHIFSDGWPNHQLEEVSAMKGEESTEQVWKEILKLHGGPLLVINGVIIPINGFINGVTDVSTLHIGVVSPHLYNW